jgi:hypothetical protein
VVAPDVTKFEANASTAAEVTAELGSFLSQITASISFGWLSSFTLVTAFKSNDFDLGKICKVSSGKSVLNDPDKSPSMDCVLTQQGRGTDARDIAKQPHKQQQTTHLFFFSQKKSKKKIIHVSPEPSPPKSAGARVRRRHPRLRLFRLRSAPANHCRDQSRRRPKHRRR